MAEPALDPAPFTRQSTTLRALARVLRPVARLLIAGGVPFQAAAESLKRAYVDAATRHFRDQARTDSRLSLLTGLNRKEVRRLTTPSADEWGPESVTSFASSVFTAWSLRPEWRDADGRPRPLPRRGEDSFDALVRSVTLDHRPASVLEELVRLGYAECIGDAEVRLRGEAFTSQREYADRLGPLAENLEDHADAAVANVTGEASRFLERSLFADELSEASARRLQEEARAQWKRMHDELIRRADELEADDRAQGRTTRTRVRIGMYAYSEERDGTDAPAAGSRETP
jgi:hypothetical protein